MSSKPFLHESTEFKELIEITAREYEIKDPSLVEKDYWLMHVLWGLKDLAYTFHLKGGTSLSKGFGCINRFSEDIDIKIEPDEAATGFTVYTGRNHEKDNQCESRSNYFEWLTSRIDGKISGIVGVKRDIDFDDKPKYRSGGIRLFYKGLFGTPGGMKDGILLEVGFDNTAPNRPCDIASWAYEQGAKTQPGKYFDNRAKGVLCYEPKFTFVEKLQAVVKKFRQYKAGKDGASLPANFIRHYYDLFQLIHLPEVQEYIGTKAYEEYKKERFRSDDTKVSNSDAFRLVDANDRALFEKEYSRSETLYFKGRPTLAQILERIGKDLDRL